MAAFFLRMGSWGWAFWILVLSFGASHFWTAAEVLHLLEGLRDAGSLGGEDLPSAGTLIWIFSRNGLVALSFSFLALCLFRMLGWEEREAEGSCLPPEGSISHAFAQAVYRQRREGRSFAILYGRWQGRKEPGRIQEEKRKGALRSRILVLIREEIRLTDYLMPVDLHHAAILVEGGMEDAEILSRRIAARLLREEVDGDPELFWAVSVYRPGDSLEELLLRAQRGLEKKTPLLEEKG